MTTRRPARPKPALPTPAGPTAAATGPSPVEVRLIGDDAAVRALVDALQNAANCGPANYRPSRYSDATRAYLSVVVPAQDT